MLRLLRSLTTAFALCVVAAATGGCAPIMQWQRQYLGDPIMQFERDPKQGELNNHIFPRREGSGGGDGSAGGGCGC